MDLILGFGLFLGSVVVCMLKGLSLGWALLVGFVCFYIVGLHRGFSARALGKMAMQGGKTAFVVLRILILIGVLTGLWRAGGTIAYFVAMGLRLITPNSFVLIACLLPAVLCLAFGSSFGVSGTAGVILMTIARSGGADPVVAAGAALSGAYFGERLSPASSAAAIKEDTLLKSITPWSLTQEAIFMALPATISSKLWAARRKRGPCWLNSSTASAALTLKPG